MQCGAQSSIFKSPAADPPYLPPPPSLPPPAAANFILPPISHVQAYSREITLKSIGPNSSAEGKEKADIDDGHNEKGHKQDGDRTATDVIVGRDPPERTADDAGSNEEAKFIPGSDKV